MVSKDDKGELLNLHVQLLKRLGRLIDRVEILEIRLNRMERKKK